MSWAKHFYINWPLTETDMKYLNKRGKMYMPDGTVERVFVKEYRSNWDEYFVVYEGAVSGGFLVPVRHMPSRFIEDRDYDHTCTCGGAKVGAPGHSKWCDTRWK